MHWRQNSTYRDDVAFIKKITARMNKQLDIINNYSLTWAEKYKEEEQDHKKANFASRFANIRLRQMVKESMKGEVIDTVNVPVICGNCEKLTIDNMCYFYKQHVPNEFIDKENDCDQYKNGVPF